MVTFVILHYKNLKDTVECLESIKKLDRQEKIKIVVVDNHTVEKKDKKIIEKYTKDLILLEENMGFAKANNIGCNYAKEKYNPDFIVVLNNDTCIFQKDFIDKIDKTYKKYKFDMLGPFIETIDGDSVNPFPVLDSMTKIKEEISKCQKLIRIYSSAALTACLNLYIWIKHMWKKPKRIKNADRLEQGVGLHGCFIIFSRKYLEHYSDVFYNETFLYHEEEFLYYRMKKDHLISIYEPSIKIFHKEGASLNYQFNKNIRNRKKYREEMRLKSLTLLKKYLEENSYGKNNS